MTSGLRRRVTNLEQARLQEDWTGWSEEEMRCFIKLTAKAVLAESGLTHQEPSELAQLRARLPEMSSEARIRRELHGLTKEQLRELIRGVQPGVPFFRAKNVLKLAGFQSVL